MVSMRVSDDTRLHTIVHSIESGLDSQLQVLSSKCLRTAAVLSSNVVVLCVLIHVFIPACQSGGSVFLVCWAGTLDLGKLSL